ncbi:dynamin family protein [Tabrizicola sp.]|jgi:GTP-binding protein EngB required for normal cell division|uniref:dynamin family protein n=1 Tax=Tabrizicola sp. TaxID=2005166 RepID=UPI001A5D6057|nr:dynamin family protein [Tabrizicola sp.]MBL9062087.1 dynamin family protein [Tabrizicola sp.]
MPLTRKPRIAIMGEFSSGKSTLCNVLMGARPLLEKVTATQLPPVWLSYGPDDAYTMGLDGHAYDLDLAELERVSLETTEHIRIFMKSDILRYCDLIDMPGISDPSMSSEVWERMAHLADAVLWCTHATQAWRQSESGVWSTFPKEMQHNSILLITRFDKILGDSDRAKVVKRVKQETENLFAEVFPVSLLQAMRAGDNEEKWHSSGADAFTTALFDIIHRIIDEGHPEPGDEGKPAITPDSADETELGQSLIAETFERLTVIRNTPVVKILPRRVEAKTERLLRTERPTAETGPTLVTFADNIVGTGDTMAAGRKIS